MKITKLALALFCVASFAVGDPGNGGSNHLSADLNGYQENPSLSTTAKGSFVAKIDPSGTMMDYTLSFDGLEGDVLQAHIHTAARGVNGGIMIWLCGTAANPGPLGTPVCPVSGTVGGTATAASVIGPGGQGINAGEFAKALAAIRAGFAYANVHSTKWPGGEIRGQINDSNGKQ